MNVEKPKPLNLAFQEKKLELSPLQKELDERHQKIINEMKKKRYEERGGSQEINDKNSDDEADFEVAKILNGKKL